MRFDIDSLDSEQALDTLLTAWTSYWCLAEYMGNDDWRFIEHEGAGEEGIRVRNIVDLVQKGMKQADSNGHNLMRKDLIRQFDDGMRDDWSYGCPFDSELADIIIQLGLFGNIIYS